MGSLGGSLSALEKALDDVLAEPVRGHRQSAINSIVNQMMTYQRCKLNVYFTSNVYKIYFRLGSFESFSQMMGEAYLEEYGTVDEMDSRDYEDNHSSGATEASYTGTGTYHRNVESQEDEEKPNTPGRLGGGSL